MIVCLAICLAGIWPACWLSACPPLCLSVCQAAVWCACLPVRLSVCLYVCLSVGCVVCLCAVAPSLVIPMSSRSSQLMSVRWSMLSYPCSISALSYSSRCSSRSHSSVSGCNINGDQFSSSTNQFFTLNNQ